VGAKARAKKLVVRQKKTGTEISNSSRGRTAQKTRGGEGWALQGEEEVWGGKWSRKKKDPIQLSEKETKPSGGRLTCTEGFRGYPEKKGGLEETRAFPKAPI